MAPSPLDLSYGAILVASMFSFFTLGIILVQAVEYYSTYRDRWAIRTIVTVCLAIALLDTALQAHWVYETLVTNFGNPAKIAEMAFEFVTETFLIGIVNVIVQNFYAWRLWKISDQRDYILPGLISVCSLTHFGIMTWMCAVMYTKTSIADVQTVFPTAWVWLSITLFTDLLVTSGMIYRLSYQTRNLRVANENLFQKVVNRTIQTNALSLIGQVCVFVLFSVKSVGFWWALLDATLVKILTFSLLGSLNARNKAKEYNNPSVAIHDISLQRVTKNPAVSGISVHVEGETRQEDDESYVGTTKKGLFNGLGSRTK